VTLLLLAVAAAASTFPCLYLTFSDPAREIGVVTN
jgi:hypothetical protein